MDVIDIEVPFHFYMLTFLDMLYIKSYDGDDATSPQNGRIIIV